MQPDGGLSRFRSAPATWLEALLLKDEEELEIQEEPLTFTQLLSNAAGPGPSSSLFPSHSQQYLSSPNPITHHDQEFEHGGKAASDIRMDNVLEDSVPCKLRAKRGFATHPRSIAERVRRTRISDRIRKLQELVPNMDKQTNTADMLDEAVAYVKFLQNQIQELSEHQRRCKCMVQE